MATLTFGEAKEVVAQYAGRGGKCTDSEEVSNFLLEVLDYMLISGAYGNYRKFCFIAERGCFTAPYEMEIPLKVKVDGEVAGTWDKWFEWHDTSTLDNCMDAHAALYEEPNRYPTVYNLPSGGAQVGVMATCTENENAHIVVKGKDPTGRTIITSHNGEQVVGEHLSLSSGTIRYTQNVFGEITEIYKEHTNGYVLLYWMRPQSNLKGFLADYSPYTINPRFRRFRLKSGCDSGSVFSKVSVLAKIRLKDKYADDDLIPFENRYALKLAAQGVHADYNDDVEVARAKDMKLMTVLERENSHKRMQNGQPIEVYKPTAGGAIQNIVGFPVQVWGNKKI